MNKPRLMSLVASFSQDNDCMGTDDIGQDIQISAETPDGGGFFFALKTERWSIDNVEELTELLNRVIKMSEL